MGFFVQPKTFEVMLLHLTKLSSITILSIDCNHQQVCDKPSNPTFTSIGNTYLTVRKINDLLICFFFLKQLYRTMWLMSKWFKYHFEIQWEQMERQSNSWPKEIKMQTKLPKLHWYCGANFPCNSANFFFLYHAASALSFSHLSCLSIEWVLLHGELCTIGLFCQNWLQKNPPFFPLIQLSKIAKFISNITVIDWSAEVVFNIL